MDKGDTAGEGTISTTDTNKSSRRDRLKGALTRTKSKFKKQTEKHNEKTESPLSDDVTDFLAAGRKSISSNVSSGDHPDSLPYQRTLPSVKGANHPNPHHQPSSRPSTSDSQMSLPRQSPRRIIVPKIDVTNSQRYPGAQLVSPQAERLSSDFLHTTYQNRSQSASSLAKGNKRRSRGLSVSFNDAPPVVIGIGGDDAQTPPVEISRAMARARSVSPMSNRLAVRPAHGRMHSMPANHLMVEPRHEPPDILKPRAFQHGIDHAGPKPGTASLNDEFQMTLQVGAGVPTAPDTTHSSVSAASPEILAPRPIRPAHLPPVVTDDPDGSNFHQLLEEGEALQYEAVGGMTETSRLSSPPIGLPSTLNQAMPGYSPDSVGERYYRRT